MEQSAGKPDKNTWGITLSGTKILQTVKTYHPMLHIIKDLPDNVVGVRVTGNVTQEHLENILIPAIDELVNRTGKIHYLLVLDTELKNWDWGAWLSDAKVGVKYFTRWAKIAVVTDNDNVSKFTSAFSGLVPGKAKPFKMSEMEAAKSWVATEN